MAGGILCTLIPVHFFYISVICIIVFGGKEFEAGREVFVNCSQISHVIDEFIADIDCFVHTDYHADVVAVSLDAGILAVHPRKDEPVEEKPGIPEAHMTAEDHRVIWRNSDS